MAPTGRDLVNWLYYGDNLEVLSRFITDETVDLVYLDPPFNKNAAYSVIFRDESGRTSDAQIMTLEDYWHWGPTPARHYEYLTNSAEHRGDVPSAVSALIGALHEAIGPSPLLAYLVEMSVRLVQMRRVLKPTGSLYLHCDPTASGYLRVILDAIFGPRNFRNEIVWQRAAYKGDARRKLGAVHDVILGYSKTDAAYFAPVTRPTDAEYAQRFDHDDKDGRGPYHLAPLDSPNPRPNLTFPYRGYQPPPKGWRVSLPVMEELDRDGRLWFPADRNGRIRRKLFLREQPGPNIGDVWTDIPVLQAKSAERLGYPTQKPVALLERIVQMASKEGDTILDPFCGCGTALEAAVRLERNWIGIDISNMAVDVISSRLDRLGVPLHVFDWPTEMDGVKRMVEGPGGRHRFEAWALARLGLGENRRGGDGGVDGRISFTGPAGRLESILVSVKSGHVGPGAVRDLKGAMTRDRAAMGLLFSFEEPTGAAYAEASAAGVYRSPVDGRQYPRVVVFTVRELLEQGRLPDLPTRQGIQEPLWPLPLSTQSVRVREVRRRLTPQTPPVREPGDQSGPVRAAYAEGTRPPESPRLRSKSLTSSNTRRGALPQIKRLHDMGAGAITRIGLRDDESDGGEEPNQMAERLSVPDS